MIICEGHVTMKPIMQGNLLVFNPGKEMPDFYFFNRGAEKTST